jgi:hypothetical protein
VVHGRAPNKESLETWILARHLAGTVWKRRAEFPVWNRAAGRIAHEASHDVSARSGSSRRVPTSAAAETQFPYSAVLDGGRLTEGAAVRKVPVRSSHQEFNPNRSRRFGSDDPALASRAASRGRKHGATP